MLARAIGEASRSRAFITCSDVVREAVNEDAIGRSQMTALESALPPLRVCLIGRLDFKRLIVFTEGTNEKAVNDEFLKDSWG
mmetsp:Transcript_11061/g.14604  ORF Transcript_11061/g.14604 Transcript_11061/m.14604 type:complete len:82 (-) Transcript_11061:115-360(-)